jgi:hypothetical protein
MWSWLLKTIGMSDEMADHLQEVTFTVHHQVVLWLGLALLIPIGYFIFRRQRQNLPNVRSGLRIALTATRILVLLLLVLVLADPYARIDHESQKKPIVALLFDHSQSMELPVEEFENEEELIRNARAAGYTVADGRADPETRKALRQVSRAKHAQNVVQQSASSFLEPLAKKFDVQGYSFARDLRPLPIDLETFKLPDPFQDQPAGTATQLGDAVTQVLNEAGGRKVAGIVMFSDGQNTGGRSPADAARAAGAVGIPVFTVPCGSSRRMRDIAIVDVFTSGLVAVDDTVRVAVTIESQGFDRETINVELKDGDKVLDSKPLVLRSTEQQPVELTFKATKPGAHYLTVYVKPHPNEPKYLHGNNTDVAFVRVSEEKLKVLYVEGLPRWDFRYLKNAMRRDHGLGGLTGKEPDIVLEAELRRLSPTTQAGLLPRTLKELAEYHTVILGDVSPQVATPEFVQLLAEAVHEKGVGLIVAAGPNFMPHAFYKRLRELLPVRLFGKSPGMEPHAGKPFQLELTPEGAVHEAMRFHDEPGRNQNAWSHMPPYYWCVAAERPAPGASVLITNPSVQGNYGKLPLVASHFAGQGKVMLVGTDSTWQWRQNVGDRFFYKFWGQSIRFVARRDEASMKKSRIEVRPVRAQPGEEAQIELMAFTGDGTPRTEPTLTLGVTGGGAGAGGEPVMMTADPATKGRYTGKFIPKTPGEYRLAFDPGGGAPAVEAKIRALVSTEELRQPNVNRPALELLAKTSGGALVELPDLGTIPNRLNCESKLIGYHREATVWDNWLTLAILIFIYSFDVGLRRLAGLS